MGAFSLCNYNIIIAEIFQVISIYLLTKKCAKILNYGVFCDSITWNMYIFHYTLEEEMSRVEFLKKFVAFNKRHKVPLPLIKAQLYVILVVCFIHYAIVKGITSTQDEA